MLGQDLFKNWKTSWGIHLLIAQLIPLLELFNITKDFLDPQKTYPPRLPFNYLILCAGIVAMAVPTPAAASPPIQPVSPAA